MGKKPQFQKKHKKKNEDFKELETEFRSRFKANSFVDKRGKDSNSEDAAWSRFGKVRKQISKRALDQERGALEGQEHLGVVKERPEVVLKETPETAPWFVDKSLDKKQKKNAEQKELDGLDEEFGSISAMLQPKEDMDMELHGSENGSEGGDDERESAGTSGKTDEMMEDLDDEEEEDLDNLDLPEVAEKDSVYKKIMSGDKELDQLTPKECETLRIEQLLILKKAKENRREQLAQYASIEKGETLPSKPKKRRVKFSEDVGIRHFTQGGRHLDAAGKAVFKDRSTKEAHETLMAKREILEQGWIPTKEIVDRYKAELQRGATQMRFPPEMIRRAEKSEEFYVVDEDSDSDSSAGVDEEEGMTEQQKAMKSLELASRISMDVPDIVDGENTHDNEDDEYDQLALQFLQEVEQGNAAKAGRRTLSQKEIVDAAKVEIDRLELARQRRMKHTQEEDDVQEMEEEEEQPNLDPAVDFEDVALCTQRLIDVVREEVRRNCRDRTEINKTRAEKWASIFVQLSRADARAAASTLGATLSAAADTSSKSVKAGAIGGHEESLECRLLGIAPPKPQSDEERDLSEREQSCFDVMLCRILSLCFPMSDFRHPVGTPLLVHLASHLGEHRVDSTIRLAVSLLKAGMILDSTSESKRYCPEVVNFLANALTTISKDYAAAVLPVQDEQLGYERDNKLLPKAILDLDIEKGLLNCKGKQSFDPKVLKSCVRYATRGEEEKNDSNPFEQVENITLSYLFCSRDPETAASNSVFRMRLIWLVYLGIARVVKIVQDSPAAVEVLYPLLVTLRAVFHTKEVPISLHSVHRLVLRRVKRAVKKCLSNRDVLLMQKHKLVPLKLYEPLLDGRDRSDVKEQRDQKRRLKKEFRQEQRNATRTVRGHSRVVSQFRDEEKAEVNAVRESKYRQIINEMGGQTRGALNWQDRNAIEKEVARNKKRKAEKRDTGKGAKRQRKE